jgi:hypothetical protein
LIMLDPMDTLIANATVGELLRLRHRINNRIAHLLMEYDDPQLEVKFILRHSQNGQLTNASCKHDDG